MGALPRRASLVNQTACNPEPHSLHHGGSGETAHRRRAVESTVDHEAHRARDLAEVRKQDHAGADDVSDAHERHEILRHLYDAPKAAEHHERHQDDTGDAHVEAEARVHGVRNRVRLNHVADPERCEARQKRKDGAEPWKAETVLQDVHCAATHRAVGIFLAIVECDSYFAKLRAHAEKARHE